MNSLTCKLNLPLGPSLRDPSLEADLQARLEDGHRIFILGDIHGHLATFRALLHRLNLKPEDRVVCLGDMIDRGPNSAGRGHLHRTHPQVICLKGNHEHMAIQCVQPDGSFEAWQPWMQRGGKSTYASYIVQANGDLYEAKRQMAEDFMWLDTLPTQIVLDHHR
ncbi:MAG: metallophosphoesterase, partial [Candidatus Thermoplasmatota archaeon]|nr:metallophosphoesterase [Candidatus Thermoplasmatota archaeon]